MPTLLSLSSQVAQGHVGHSANIFVWQRLGMDIIALPTVLLSNRPDLPRSAGERIRPELLEDMLDAIEANGWFGRVDAVFTGYLPSADHVFLAARLVQRMKIKNSALIYCCDPILGDHPDGLYVAEEAALALKSALVPLASVLTPNRFELEWLTGAPVLTRDQALKAARNLPGLVLATSAPSDTDDTLVNLLVDRTQAWQATVNLRQAVPHGTGDFIAALFLAYLLRDCAPPNALARAISGVEAVIAASDGVDDLNLVGGQEAWVAASPWPVESVTAFEP